nr:hypothetical protein [Providencia rustigianii]
MRNIPEPVFTPVAENIKANREDERKSLMNRYADRQRQLADKILTEKLDYAQIHQLLVDEADKFESQAGELNYVWCYRPCQWPCCTSTGTTYWSGKKAS